MYILTNHNGVILHTSRTIGYQENGNVLVDGGSLAYAAILVGGVSGDVAVPEGVRPQTHTYIDGTFAENPNYVAPVREGDLRDEITQLQLALVELATIVTGGGI